MHFFTQNDRATIHSCLCRTHESIGRFVDGLNMDAINLLTLHTMLLGCTFATFLVVLVGFVLL